MPMTKAMENRVKTGVHFMLGNYALVEGAISAGCDFFGGYPTNYFRGLVPLQTENRMIEQLFVSQNEKDRKSPMEIYTSEQDYWTLTRWNNMLEASGI